MGNGVVAAALSIVVPGLGQLYNGQLLRAIVFFIIAALLYMTVVLGVLWHIYVVYDAYQAA